MNKIGNPTYLINVKDYLIVTADRIEGGHGLPLDSNCLWYQLQCVIKAVNFWCDDNKILNNSTPQLFPPSCLACKQKGK